MTSFIYLYNNIKKEKFSFLFYVMPERGLLARIRDFVFFKLSGIKNIVGLSLNISLSIGIDRYKFPEGLRLINNITNTHIDLKNNTWWKLNITKYEIQEAKFLLANNSISTPYIVICPGTKQEIKDWEISNWLMLIKLLNIKYTTLFSMVFIGSKDERERCDQLIAEWKGGSINLCGFSEPRISAAILSSALLFIGHDSGPMHLAASVGTPIIAIFSSRNLPGEWFPFGKKNKIFYSDVECKGCYLTECIKYNKKCILSIKPYDVFLGIENLITKEIINE